VRFVAWLGIGLAIYFPFGRRHSALAQKPTKTLDAKPLD